MNFLVYLIENNNRNCVPMVVHDSCMKGEPLSRYSAAHMHKYNSAGRSDRKKRRDRQKKRWEDNIKEWAGMDVVNSTREEENRTRWKWIVTMSSVMPQRPRKVIG